jgi:hypothetical protein
MVSCMVVDGFASITNYREVGWFKVDPLLISTWLALAVCPRSDARPPEDAHPLPRLRQDPRPCTDCRPERVPSLQDMNDQSSCAEFVFPLPRLTIKLVIKGS